MHRPLIVLVALTACDRTDTEATAASKQQLADARASCVQVFQRQRACTDTFIPALVDLRRDLDKPAGIAKEPRAELIATALEEWKTDSTDAAISQKCEQLAPSLPAAGVAESKRCVALGPCGEFVTCVLPMMRDHLSR